MMSCTAYPVQLHSTLLYSVDSRYLRFVRDLYVHAYLCHGFSVCVVRVAVDDSRYRNCSPLHCRTILLQLIHMRLHAHSILHFSRSSIIVNSSYLQPSLPSSSCQDLSSIFGPLISYFLFLHLVHSFFHKVNPL